MDTALRILRALGEPTRLRIVALVTRSPLCVTELVDILGQSQPRLSRHLKLLCDAGALERLREGANVWFAIPAQPNPEVTLVHEVIARLDFADPSLAADRRAAARVLAERARTASDAFARAGADWDETRALGLPADAVEDALLALLPPRLGHALDIGTGTGRMLEVLAPRLDAGLGIDMSRPMLALARARLARPGLAHLAVRRADMYDLRLPARFDLVLLHMVLHHAEDPAAALREAATALSRDGRLVVIDLAPHDPTRSTTGLAHRWPGFADPALHALLRQAGLAPAAAASIPGPLETRIWTARRAEAPARAESASLELVP